MLTTGAPHIQRLPEAEPRQGFFEWSEFEATREQLPAHVRGPLTRLFRQPDGSPIKDSQWRKPG